ncbi:MAG: hypothetical protein HOV96_26275 [Nonomuraea sp.]|nr:hypothetical protein [Nonomuraea sp.]NUS07255.1 hypothetical protein [Nonomuraea sp.]
MSQGDSAGHPYQPYGAPYGDQPPPGYGYGYAPPPRRDDGPQANAIVAVVLNFLSLASCCNVFGLPGGILAAVALSRVREQPASARSLLVWSWVLFGAGLTLNVGLFLFLGLTGRLDDD